MNIRLNATAATGIFLVGVAAINAGHGAIGRVRPANFALSEPAAALSTNGRHVLERCRQNVTIIHDVHWAAACMGNTEDDSPECTLPEDRAAALNTARSTAENMCIDEAVATERGLPQ